MKAGRELDALIAEKVMGWKRSPGDHELQRGLWRPQDGEEFWVGQNQIPPYSTDIAAAWEVVDKLAMARWQFRLFVSPEGKAADFERWAHETDGANWKETGQALEPTAPHAICLAALKAVHAEGL